MKRYTQREQGRRVFCPICQAPPAANCIRRNGDMRSNNHQARNRKALSARFFGKAPA